VLVLIVNACSNLFVDIIYGMFICFAGEEEPISPSVPERQEV